MAANTGQMTANAGRTAKNAGRTAKNDDVNDGVLKRMGRVLRRRGLLEGIKAMFRRMGGFLRQIEGVC